MSIRNNQVLCAIKHRSIRNNNSMLAYSRTSKLRRAAFLPRNSGILIMIRNCFCPLNRPPPSTLTTCGYRSCRAESPSSRPPSPSSPPPYMTSWFRPTAENYFGRVQQGRHQRSAEGSARHRCSRLGEGEEIRPRRHRGTATGGNRLAAGVAAQSRLTG